MTSVARNSAQVKSHGLHKRVPSPQPDRDVPGQVIVVALAPQGSGQEDQLLFQGEIGKELVGGGYEVGHGRHVSGSGWR